jgi:RNA polymerase sigma-70 factor (ECF subfamily)
MIALSKLDQFDPATNFLAWMGRIVRYVALNHARRRKRAPAVVVDPQTLESTTSDSGSAMPATGTDIRIDEGDFDDDVVAALHGLDEVPRTCLLLRTLMQLPYRDISLALDIPEGTAMSHVHRARQLLRRRLSHLAPARSSTEPRRP